MDANRNPANPAIERLLRWVVSKATMLMVDAVRWEIVISGKGSQYSCRYTVYEDPP